MNPAVRALSHLYLGGDHGARATIIAHANRAHGCISGMARALGISRMTIYGWKSRDPILEAAIKTARARARRSR